MEWLAGPYAAAALLLAGAGAPKVWRPHSTVRALASMRLPATPARVRVLGTAEILIALVALTTGGSMAPVLVAASYTVFTVFVALARARGGVLSSCGCFGRADTPPTRTHLAVTGGAAAIAFAVAVDPIGPLRGVVAGAPMSGLPFLGLTAVCVWFAYLALAVLPRAGGRPVAVAAGARRT